MILPKVDIKKILFATDLSETSRQALAYAVSLSNHYNAGITILHALEDSPGISAAIMYHVGPEQWAEIQKRHEDNARARIIAKRKEDDPAMKEALVKVYEKAARDYENQSFTLEDIVVRKGNPVDLIIETAEDLNCDLIVLGTQGHTLLAQMMIGSTAKKVLKRSTIPVLVVRLSDKL
ncbi:MAG: universal stress protein [Pseudomonadota bacterium]